MEKEFIFPPCILVSNKVRVKDSTMPIKSIKWSTEAKFSVIVEIAFLSEAERSQFCRGKDCLSSKLKFGCKRVCKGLREKRTESCRAKTSSSF